MADESRIPRVVIEASAARTLPIGAADGFVLSRIDGRASEKELAGLTGLPDAQIRASLDKLFNLKVIAFGPVETSAPVGAAKSAPRPPTGGENGSTHSSLLDDAIAKIADDLPELLEPCDLPPELRKRILGLSSVIASLDHYAVLGIPRSVDKKGVKRAYFELAALYHPDRYFRKNLGSFKPKMEVIFAKVSTAYETLADKSQRADYDAYLGDLEKSRNVEAMLRNVLEEVETAQKTAREFAEAPSSPSVAAASPPAGGAVYAVPVGAPVGIGAPPPPPTPAKSTAADQLRREALARRLGAGRPLSRPPPVAPTTEIPAISRMSAADAQDAVKRMYHDRIEAGRQLQADKYVKLGQAGEAKGDLTAAAASYRVALTFLKPEDPAYAHAEEVIAKSEASLAEIYMRQADHEDRAARWEDACRSWARAYRIRPNDARVLERYANALVKTNGNLHEAAQLAQRAVALEPTLGDYRCTLASVYMAAGLWLNAKRELEAASLQFPENPNVAALLKKITSKST